MPRPQKALRPEDGAGARLALEVRALRDELGEEAPTVEELFVTTGVSPATIYAVFSGRIPTWENFKTIVVALKGDPRIWRPKWRKAEYELQLERREKRSASTRLGPRSSSASIEEDRSVLVGPRHVELDPSELIDRRNDLSRGLTKLLNDQNISTAELVMRSKISRSTAYNIIQGIRVPSWDTVRQVVEAAGGDVNEFRELWVAAALKPGPPHLS